MTLIFFDGLLDVVTQPKPEWNAAVGGWSNTQAGRDGSTNGSARLSGVAGAGVNTKVLDLPTPAATCIVGFAFINIGGWDAGNTHLVGFARAIGAGNLELVLVNNTTTGALELRLGGGTTGTLLASSSVAYPADQWRHVQAKVVLHPTAGSCEVRQDGVTVISYTGQTAVTAGAVASLSFKRDGVDGYWDDLYVCDAVDATATQGRPNNDFLGDLKVQTLIPSANGDLTAWSKSTGTNAAVLVDEVPPNTTDYIFSSVSGQRELMTLPDLPATATAVYGARVSLYAFKTDAGITSVKPLIKESGGTITAQTAAPLSTTAGSCHGAFLYTKPSAPTTPWTVADINGLQAGAELA